MDFKQIYMNLDGKCTLKRNLNFKIGIYYERFLIFTEGVMTKRFILKTKKNPKALGSRILKGNLIVICYSCLFF